MAQYRAAKKQDLRLDFRVTTREFLKVVQPALTGATSLVVEPASRAIGNGDKLLLRENVILTTGGAVAAGAVAVTVSATPGPIYANEILSKIRDLTGGDYKFELLAKAGDATPLIAKDATIDTADEGLLHFLIDAADWDDIVVGNYYWSFWRRDSGAQRPIKDGMLQLYNAGFQ